MRMHAGLRGARRLARGIVWCVAALAVAAVWPAASGTEGGGLLRAEAAAPAQPQNNSQWTGRMSAEQDLVWLLAGTMAMEKDRKLALTRAQAARIWPVFDSLVKKGHIRLQVDPAQFEAGARSGWQGQTGQNPGQRDDARMQELRKQREARENAIEQAIAQMEKVLSAKQTAYIDNFDFKPEKYGLVTREAGWSPSGGQAGAQASGQRTPPSQADIKRLTETAKQNALKLAAFYREYQTFIKKKAGVKP